VIQSDEPKGIALQRTATLRLADEREIVVFTTRRNFLDWIVSHVLSREEDRFRGPYTDEQWAITKEVFDHRYKAWHEWHHATLPRLMEIRRKADRSFHVIDYEEIADPDALKAFVLQNIPGATATRFRIPTKKQKTKQNSEYISNYDEVLSWYADKLQDTPIPTL